MLIRNSLKNFMASLLFLSHSTYTKDNKDYTKLIPFFLISATAFVLNTWLTESTKCSNMENNKKHREQLIKKARKDYEVIYTLNDKRHRVEIEKNSQEIKILKEQIDSYRENIKCNQPKKSKN